MVSNNKDNTDYKKGGKIEGGAILAKKGGKILAIGILISVVIFIICFSCKDKFISRFGNKSGKKNTNKKNDKNNKMIEDKSSDKSSEWDLKSEIKKLEDIQTKNMQTLIAKTNDPLADL